MSDQTLNYRSDSLRQVSLLIGQDRFEDLLIRLPDSFFSLLPENKNRLWDELLHEINQGVNDPVELAKRAKLIISDIFSLW